MRREGGFAIDDRGLELAGAGRGAQDLGGGMGIQLHCQPNPCPILPQLHQGGGGGDAAAREGMTLLNKSQTTFSNKLIPSQGISGTLKSPVKPHLRTCFIHSRCTGSIASEKREKGGEQKRYKRILAAAGEREEDWRDPYFLLGVRPPGSKAMEPSVSTQVEEKPKERKKIQFAVTTEVEEKPKERKKLQFAMSSDDEDEPRRGRSNFNMPRLCALQLDPRQVEMIRRRRPTPATLFRVADQSSPEDDQSTHQWVVGENGVLKPKRVNPNVYQPPSLKAVQKMAEAHMQHLGIYPPLEDPCEGEEEDNDWQGEDTSPTQAADHTETTTEQSDKFSS
ncbi:hypothetical protein KUCAC02_007464, partial [Chaenocephalus aceratus]